MPSPPIRDRVGLSPELRQQIETELANHNVLDRVVKWGSSCAPQRAVLSVVTQDEYTHDIVIPWGNGLFLVYDCT